MKKITVLIIALFCFCGYAGAKNYQSCIDDATDAQKIGDNDLALECFKEAVRYKNDDPHAMFQMGRIYEEKGNISQAKECYETVLARTSDPQLVYDVGAFYMRIGDISKVEDIYTDSWRRKVNSIEANMGMGDYNFIIKNYRKAIEFYEFVTERENAVKNNQMLALAYFRYAVCLEATEKRDKALEMCRKAMRLDSSEEIKNYYNSLKKKR